MAYEIPVLPVGVMTATANYSSATSQYTLVKSTSISTFTKQTTVGAPVTGVLQDTPSSGQAGQIMMYGITKVRVNSTAHAAIAVGDALHCSTSACALPLSTAGGTRVTKYVWGRALETLSSNSTGIITALITHQGSGSSGAAAA